MRSLQIVGSERTFVSRWTTVARLPGFVGGSEEQFKWTVENLAISMLANHEEIQRNCHHDARFLNPSSLKAAWGVCFS